jgi:hypothetical protein
MKPFARFAGVIAVAILFLVAAGAQSQPKKPRQPNKSSWVNGVEYDGVPITCDLAESQQMKNIGSRLDGAGMCVFSAIEMAARYQNLEQMRGWRNWCAAKYRGGGWPQKVDQCLAAWFKLKGIEPIPYLQYLGKEPEPLLALINRTNRMGSVTYGFSPRYIDARNPSGLIGHMVNNVLYENKYGTVLDNNFIGDRNLEWMPKEELVRRMRLQPNGQVGAAWVFVWLPPGAPPPPKGKR